jgi:hypothetical protein
MQQCQVRVFPQFLFQALIPNEWCLKNGLHGGGLNPGPLGHESSALTTRPRLLTFSRNFDESIFLSRLLRRIEIVEICQDASRFVKICRDSVKIRQEILTLSRPFESENNEKSWRIEKSWQENAKIHALLKFLDFNEFLDLNQDFLV